MKTNKEKILCIFPEDPSLSFLSSLRAYLVEYYSYHIIEPTEESYNKTIDLIASMEANSLILFFGHGASHCFYGACSNIFPQKQLVNRSNIGILANKNMFALTCRSNDFFDYHKASINDFFGFGNMPTDWEEIVAERNTGDPFYLRNINETEIDVFKRILNNIVLSAFQSTDDLLNFESLYLSIKLNINKSISKLLIDKRAPNYREIANILFYMKEDILVRI